MFASQLIWFVNQLTDLFSLNWLNNNRCSNLPDLKACRIWYLFSRGRSHLFHTTLFSRKLLNSLSLRIFKTFNSKLLKKIRRKYFAEFFFESFQNVNLSFGSGLKIISGVDFTVDLMKCYHLFWSTLPAKINTKYILISSPVLLLYTMILDEGNLCI